MFYYNYICFIQVQLSANHSEKKVYNKEVHLLFMQFSGNKIQGFLERQISTMFSKLNYCMNESKLNNQKYIFMTNTSFMRLSGNNYFSYQGLINI